MAVIKRSVIGKMTGKVGDVVVQHRFKKRVVSLRPEHYVTVSEKVKEQRKKFGFKVYFSKSVNKNDLLRLAWKYVKRKRVSYYHNIFSFNSKQIKHDMPTALNCITPTYYAERITPNVLLTKFRHEFKGDSIKFYYNISAEDNNMLTVPYAAVAVFFLFFSDGKDERYTHFIVEKSVETEEKNDEGLLTLEMNFDEKQRGKLRTYRLLRGYLAHVKPNSGETDVLNFSDSVFFEESLNEYFKSDSII